MGLLFESKGFTLKALGGWWGLVFPENNTSSDPSQRLQCDKKKWFCQLKVLFKQI